MFKIRLRQLKDKQRDKWLKAVLPLVIGKDRREADKILFDTRVAKQKEMKELAEEKGVNLSVFYEATDDLRDINQLILYTYFPYTPEYQPGVVPPKGGPYDVSLEERFRLDKQGYGVKDGQLTTRVFKGNRKHVTVSVEGFDKPLKLKTTFIENKDKSSTLSPVVLGDVVIGDIRYTFSPGENKLVWYSDRGKIDEGKPWELISERPLSESQIERRARTAKRRATQLAKAEKAYLDDYLFNMIKDWEEKREEDYQRSRKAAEGTYWQYEIQRGAAITIPIMGDLMYSFQWPDEPSEKAKSAFSYNTRYAGKRFSESMIRNSLNRLLRKELISKGDTARGAPSEYWIRVPYDE